MKTHRDIGNMLFEQWWQEQLRVVPATVEGDFLVSGKRFARQGWNRAIIHVEARLQRERAPQDVIETVKGFLANE